MKLTDFEIRSLIAMHADMLSDSVIANDICKHTISDIVGRIMELAETLSDPEREEMRVQ